MKVSVARNIEPLSDFRTNSADFIKRLKRDKQPIVLTQHGKSAAVLLDVSEFDRVIERLELLEDLLEAKEQVERGEVYTVEQARARINEHIAKWK